LQKSPAFFQHRLEKELNERGVRCEERPPKFINVEQDLWQSGMYVYYHGDIVYFISNPMQVRAKEGSIYLPNRTQFVIITNSRVDGKENVFRSAEVKTSVRETVDPPRSNLESNCGHGGTESSDLDAERQPDDGGVPG
jgi:hypothetical protein